LYFCSTTPFFFGVQNVENCLAISCDSQNSWIHLRYIHLDFHMVISLVYFLRMCFYKCFIKLNLFCNTYDFFLMKQAWVYIDKSSIIKTKYQTSPCVCVCVGPHISKWISPNNVMAHVPLSFGNAHWYCFHIKHRSYTMVSW
jgi:hypothetical protein